MPPPNSNPLSQYRKTHMKLFQTSVAALAILASAAIASPAPATGTLGRWRGSAKVTVGDKRSPDPKNFDLSAWHGTLEASVPGTREETA
ncbi:hypothetical protein D9756_002026 [Leucocoprinus leucothites]|uniref:Uncharacterized protein n=1 Tax=Leucocoprinus leucothites TaxID=201217 RepID=A0A8H5GC82_9AGAR|nr:hypothetical protein D9756_002026 [Leucoagaricus leucothites]